MIVITLFTLLRHPAVAAGENADDFDQLRAELMAEHDPQSVLGCELVERLAGILGGSAAFRSLRLQSSMLVN
jgi:hypothetical protein